ncbi:bet1-like protein At4g14600 [Camellia sinensis]|uniref:bet1-like protein At4g14600 n=1 Tax=Camellia sinensis TaxID=4442 RepID=UPI001036A2D4|nr:bet1-like protein At4g14600 [Camellia sinensis]
MEVNGMVWEKKIPNDRSVEIGKKLNNLSLSEGGFYGAAPYRSRLSTRQVASSDEIQLQIDPMHGDLDDEITGLRKQVGQLKFVPKEIGTEAKFRNDFLNELQMTLIKAQAGVKNNMRRLNKSIIQHGSNHVIHVVLFALICFSVVYFWSKFSQRLGH